MLRICCALAWGAVLSAEGWPGWRGARRDGRLEGLTPSTPIPKSLEVEWKLVVGEGHASPIGWGGTVFVFSREGEEEVLRAVDLKGKPRWRAAYPAPYKMNEFAVSHGPGPKSTPVHAGSAAGGRVITLGISGILSAFDAATGETRWRKDFSKELKATSPLYGAAMSPLVAEGLCIAHVGGHDHGALRAFDLETGEPRWSFDGDGPGYASPLLAEWQGTKQVVTQTQSRLVGVRLGDGKLLWSLPFTTEYDQNSVTALVDGDHVIYSGYQKPVAAVRVSQDGATWSAAPAWSNSEVSQFMSSPVLHEGLVFGLSMKQKGQLFCLDAATGKTHWKGRGRLGENAALVLLGPLLAVLTTDAELHLAKPTARGEEVLATYKVADSATWAHPLFVPGKVLVKDKSSLICLKLP